MRSAKAAKSAKYREAALRYHDSRRVEGLTPLELRIVVAVTTFYEVRQLGAHPAQVARLFGRGDHKGPFVQMFRILVHVGWLRAVRATKRAGAPGLPKILYVPSPKALLFCYPKRKTA